MGSFFGAKPVKPLLPSDVMARCKEHPECLDTFKEVSIRLKPDQLLPFYRALAKYDERHSIGVARALATSENWDLAILHFRKAIGVEPRREYTEELARAYESAGQPAQADKVRQGF